MLVTSGVADLGVTLIVMSYWLGSPQCKHNKAVLPPPEDPCGDDDTDCGGVL
jgi:hypothetical protein